MLCYGMYHTANPEPPEIFHGQKDITKLKQQYRSLTTYSIQLRLGANGEFDSVRRLPNSDAILDAGYTPPFDSGWELWKGRLLIGLLYKDPTIMSQLNAEGNSYSPGEKSSLSQIVLPGGEWQNKGVTPLAYSSIKANQGEVILGHSLIKFRVGTRGDYIAVVAVGTPNHVPWVWCEAMLTYKDNNLILYGAGSAFPCHAFYVGDEQKARIDLTTDRNTLRTVFSTGFPAKISWAPVPLPANPHSVVAGINPQAPMTETSNGNIITAQSYTAPANGKSIRRVLPLVSLKCWGVPITNDPFGPLSDLGARRSQRPALKSP
jgi:hypothetical protein